MNSWMSRGAFSPRLVNVGVTEKESRGHSSTIQHGTFLFSPFTVRMIQ